MPSKDTVVDPFHILDVSEISECIVGHRDMPELALLRRFSPRLPSTAAVRGSIINAAFDILVSNPDAIDDDLIGQAMQLRPLSVAAVGKGVDIESIVKIIPRLRDALSHWKSKKISVEPQVVSNTWGLQGRFDILVENDDDVDLIELKSGSAPTSAIRANHIAQAAAYALLYGELDHKPLRSVQVWYATAEARQFRPISSDEMSPMQRRVIDIRNRIIELEHQLAERNFSLLGKLDGRMLAGAGIIAQFESEFAAIYRMADVSTRTLVQAWMSFLFNEQHAIHKARGESESSTIRDLWLNLQDSDLGKMHLYFESRLPILDTPLRRGDPIIIQQQTDSQRHTLLKGSIRTLTQHTIGVTLRNKQADLQPLNIFKISRDYSDSGTRSLFPSLIEFLGAEEKKRRQIIGDEPPENPSPITITDDNLFPDQRHTIEEALGSKGLYFIQGPPGTGKTSIILRALVHRILESNSERILVLAYTNRAVAEVCDALNEVDYLRHGSKDGMLASRQHEKGIPFLAHSMSAEHLAERIRSCRVIVSTIHSIHSSPEILLFGKFTTLIVDEASQVLDAHIVGLLSQVGRSILIGDQCQLPAVVTQSESSLNVDSPLLARLEVSSLGLSYFERMVRCYSKNGWKGAFSTLTSQGRMHAEVAKFPSQESYGNRLQTISTWQRMEDATPWHSVIPHRSVFIDVNEPPDKQSHVEAQVLATLAGKIHDLAIQAGDYSIGIITPFRSQNTLVTSLLRTDLQSQIIVDTVERFQGSQRDIVLYGTGVFTSDEFATIRSETEIDGKIIDRKLNVAATRARHQFLLIGRAGTLSVSPSYRRFMKFNPNLTKPDLS